MKQTLYEILEVPPDADSARIDAAFHRLSADMGANPDGYRQVLLKEAHDVLSNPRQRAAYDAARARPTPAAEPAVPDADPAETGAGRPRWLAGALVLAAVIALAAWQVYRPAPPGAATPAAAAPAVPAGGDTEAAPVATGKSAEELYSRLSGSVALVVVANERGLPLRSGSGVVVDEGSVITNCHVTKGSAQIKVKVAGRIHDAMVLTTDELYDLCRLSVTGLAAPPVSVGSVASLKTGQKVYAIGAPHGLELTISDGIVSSLRETPNGTFIQTTAPISPGSSGGGLFNADGQLVGVVTFQHRFGQNLNFAVPADWIRDMRERSAPAGAESETPVEPPKKSPAAVEAEAMAMRLVGSWHCFRPALGRHMDLDFRPGGTVTVSSAGKSYQGNYQIVGRVLTLYGSDTLSVTIEEISDRRMSLGAASDKRMACDRQG